MTFVLIFCNYTFFENLIPDFAPSQTMAQKMPFFKPLNTKKKNNLEINFTRIKKFNKNIYNVAEDTKSIRKSVLAFCMTRPQNLMECCMENNNPKWILFIRECLDKFRLRQQFTYERQSLILLSNFVFCFMIFCQTQ